MAIGQNVRLGLSHSAGEKLARFLLQLVGNFPEDKGQVGLKLALTYEEIGGLIGLSRETVTRLLADFRKNQWLQVTGCTLIIKNRSALESFINGFGSKSGRTVKEVRVFYVGGSQVRELQGSFARSVGSFVLRAMARVVPRRVSHSNTTNCLAHQRIAKRQVAIRHAPTDSFWVRVSPSPPSLP